MDKKQKIVFILIISIILIIIVLAMLILSLLNNKKNNKENYNNTIVNTDNKEQTEIYYNSEWNAEKENIEKRLKYVESDSTYFTIEALANSYVNLIMHGKKEQLKLVLSPLYTNKYNINNNNILNIANIPQIDNETAYKTIILEMKEVQLDNNIYVYIVSGKGRIEGKNDKFTFNLMIEVDISKQIYNIYPEKYMKDNGFDNLKVGDILNNYNIEEITNRNDNYFVYIGTKTDQDMANKYFDNYHELLIYYKDDAYKKLNSEYSKKRFGSKESFDDYLNENKILIATMNIDKYKVITGDNYKDYVCSDKNNNIYVFRELDGIMRYSVFLDNYTVMLDEDVQKYNGFSKFEKGKYNLSKFIKMVNTKDYNAIYNVLNSTFKNNNFKTVNDLKAYIKDNLYDINSIEIEEYDKDTYEYYVFNCKITNLRNTEQTKKMTIIINQTDGTDFDMSFSFER